MWRMLLMKGVKYGKQMKKFIKQIKFVALNESVDSFFKELKDFQEELAAKIPEQEQEKYQKYFDRYMIHELNLVRIELRKIEFNYKESVHRTSKQIEKFNSKLADPNLRKDMREFYQEEYLNILKPMYTIEQILENFRKYFDVLKTTHEEFSEWFFLGRIDFLKQLLQPFIVVDEKSKKEKEIWIYKKYSKKMTADRVKRMYQQVGLTA